MPFRKRLKPKTNTFVIYLSYMKNSNKRVTLISALASLFLLIGTIVIYLYANGWRIDPLNQQVLKTGVLTVESDPFLSDLKIDGKNKGKTPKSASLQVGEYDITVSKDGYQDWNKEVEIKQEKSTNVFPWLVRKEIGKRNIETITGETFVNSWMNTNSDHILILTYTQDETTLSFSYKLWLYNVNTTFWDLSSNPKVLLSFDATTQPEISILQSPNGQYAILKYAQESTSTTYLLDISKIGTLSDLTVLNTNQFDSYNMAWSNNNKYLMFESDQDLISFNIDRQTRYLLIKKSADTKYIWNTDEQGYFYTVETALDNENDKVYAYILTQEEMDGSNPKVLVNDLFFQKNKEYILRYRDEDPELTSSSFTNSTASTKSVGMVEKIVVNQYAQGIYIQTDTASYWYNILTKRYYLISPYESNLVLFAPDNRKLLYKDTNGYGVFTFLKEEANPNVEIGSKSVGGLNGSAKILGWLSNSLYIQYIQDNNVYICDKDGDNNIMVLENADTFKHLGITYSRDNIFTISATEASDTSVTSISIDTYLIH